MSWKAVCNIWNTFVDTCNWKKKQQTNKQKTSIFVMTLSHSQMESTYYISAFDKLKIDLGLGWYERFRGRGHRHRNVPGVILVNKLNILGLSWYIHGKQWSWREGQTRSTQSEPIQVNMRRSFTMKKGKYHNTATSFSMSWNAELISKKSLRIGWFIKQINSVAPATYSIRQVYI